MDAAGKRAWILTPEKPIDARAVFLGNYWPVVSLVLDDYAPAAITGISAIKLYMEDFAPPEELPVYQGANQSEYALSLHTGFSLRLRPRSVPASRVQRLNVPGKATVPVLSPADTLITLEEPEIASAVEQVSAWLRHLVVRTPDLEAVVDENPRPVILHRLADMAAALGNKGLAEQVEASARRISPRTSTPARTGVGTRIRVPDALLRSPRGSGSPWLDEQMMRLARQEAVVRELVGKKADKLPRLPWSVLRRDAEQTKAHDAYHSTTMEGYRISREASDAIVRGEPLPDGPQDRKALEAAMAVQGYSLAFGEVVERARRKEPIDASLILDLHEALFRPSVDAGITDTAALRGWRQSSVGLRGWRHVPPNPKKIPDLLEGLQKFAARADLPAVTRALLVHLEFVTIHPFLDGNGRIGRLVMNHALLSAGLPWVTVPADERVPFFKAIERAQVDGETDSFVQFLWHLFEQTVKSLEKKRSPGRRRKP